MPDRNLIHDSEVDEHEQTGGSLADEVQAGPAQREALKRMIDQVLNTLTPRECEIIKLRYGLDHPHRHKLAQVSQLLGIPSGRIRQIEAKAVRKLQHPMRSRQLEGF